MLNYIKSHGPFNPIYLKRIESTLDKAIAEHHKTIAIRFDLRFPPNINIDSPEYFFDSDASVISRFFSHLKDGVHYDLLKRGKNKSGSPVYPNRLRYIWAREQDQADRQHYHVFIFLNNDNYNGLGDIKFSDNQYGLASKIQAAWCRAVGVPVEVFYPLVHFPDNRIYCLDAYKGKNDYDKDRCELLYRASYLAKDRTKHYGNDYRSFGCSQC